MMQDVTKSYALSQQGGEGPSSEKDAAQTSDMPPPPPPQTETQTQSERPPSPIPRSIPVSKSTAEGSSSGLKKKKIIGEDDIDEETEAEIEAKLEEAARIAAQAKRDAELDAIAAIAREEERKEKAKAEAEQLVETRKLIFGLWTVDRMVDEAIKNPKDDWIQPKVSFETENTVNCQLDFPITAKALIWRCFENFTKYPISNIEVSMRFLSFYFNNAKPQYRTWSLVKILGIKAKNPTPNDGFTNLDITLFRGDDRLEEKITLADLPFMNPADWIAIFRILAREYNKYQPLADHFKRLIFCYIGEIALQDIEIASMLGTTPKHRPEDQPPDVNSLPLGVISNANWRVVFRTSTPRGKAKRAFFLQDKGLFSSELLEHLITLVSNTKKNSESDKKCFCDMLQWYLAIRKTLKTFLAQIQGTPMQPPKREE